MTSYIYYTASTLDGFLADPDDSLDWLLTQPIDDDGPFSIADLMSAIGTVVMGATTYEWLLAHQGDEPWPYAAQRTFVFTHRDLVPAHPSITMIAGTPAEHRALLEAVDGGVWVVGGGDLAAQFATAGMLDEMLISYAPVVLGEGRPLFTGRFDFELLETAQNQAFLIGRYRVVGARG